MDTARKLATLTDPAIALLYWTENIRTDLASSGVPTDGLTFLRQNYVKGATRNPEAMKQIREHYGIEERG